VFGAAGNLLDLFYVHIADVLHVVREEDLQCAEVVVAVLLF
jgi:hypothetical protein